MQKRILQTSHCNYTIVTEICQLLFRVRSLFFWYLNPLYKRTLTPRFPTIILAAISNLL